jgi:DtxR family transcriptional regulator, Mn-dependent transcriptional regulator
MESVSVQDYLQTIYRLQEEELRASTSALAGRLGVAPASVTGMIRKLHRDGLVDYAPYRGVVLTETGETAALRVLRRHRLWELFLTEVLDLPWDEVHVEAHRLEHATSERVAERLAAFMQQPEVDPHGQPIPAGDGRLPARQTVTLLQAKVGQQVQVVEVPDADAAMLRRLAVWQLVPGATVTVLERDEASGATRVRAGGENRLLDKALATGVHVAAAGQE